MPLALGTGSQKGLVPTLEVAAIPRGQILGVEGPFEAKDQVVEIRGPAYAVVVGENNEAILLARFEDGFVPGSSWGV